jgi:hypothetical protein
MDSKITSRLKQSFPGTIVDDFSIFIGIMLFAYQFVFY